MSNAMSTTKNLIHVMRLRTVTLALTIRDGLGFVLLMAVVMGAFGTLAHAADQVVTLDTDTSKAGVFNTSETIPAGALEANPRLLFVSSSVRDAQTLIQAASGQTAVIHYDPRTTSLADLVVRARQTLDGRWTKHASTDNFIQFTGDACTLNDGSTGGPQNLGHVKVE